MSLIPYESSRLWNRLQEDMNQFFKTPTLWSKLWPEDDSNIVTAQWIPSVNIQELNDKFVISADIPGVNPEDVHVDMENGTLSIHGERKTQETSKTENGYRRVECSYGAFHRRFSLPDTADANKIQAKSKNGVLEIIIGKREAAKAKAIKVEH